MLPPTQKITVVILTYNSERFLRPLITSLLCQSEKDLEILAVDNDSHDATVEILKKEFPQVRVIVNPENYWFSKGFNIGIEQARGEYIMICNHDIVLEPDFVSEILKAFKKDSTIGAVAGKLRKFPSDVLPFSYDLETLKKRAKTFTIDTTGIQAFRNRRFIDRGESEMDLGQYDTEEEVFGVSGALICFRRDVLAVIKYNNEYFDEDFKAYKEDVDISWRIRHAGFKLWYTPRARGYHNRRVNRTTNLSDFGTMKNRKGKSKVDNIQSYKNHWLVLIKDEHRENFLKDFFPIVWYELKKFLYILVFEQRTLAAIPLFFKQLRAIREKRKGIFAHSKLSAADVRKWFH